MAQKVQLISGNSSDEFSRRSEMCLELLMSNSKISNLTWQFSACIWLNDVWYTMCITYNTLD